MRNLAEILLRILEIQEHLAMEIIGLKKKEGWGNDHLKETKGMLEETKKLSEMVEMLNNQKNNHGYNRKNIEYLKELTAQFKTVKEAMGKIVITLGAFSINEMNNKRKGDE